MKYVLFAIILTVTGSQGDNLTQTLTEANIKIDLPNDAWSLASKEENNGMTVYIYKRQPVKDSDGRQIIPNIAVIIEDVENGLDAVSYSGRKRSAVDFEVVEVFTHENGKLKFRNAIAYKGRYRDRSGLEHTIYIVHGINGAKGLQLICDTTSSVIETLEQEFLKTLISLRS